MKDFLIGLFSILLLICLVIGLSYAIGWIGVHQTKTIYKTQQNAEREVYEESQSYVFAKRQEALKFYKEYKNADSEQKQIIKQIVSLSFAEFDEEKYLSNELKVFISQCKYDY